MTSKLSLSFLPPRPPYPSPQSTKQPCKNVLLKMNITKKKKKKSDLDNTLQWLLITLRIKPRLLTSTLNQCCDSSLPCLSHHAPSVQTARPPGPRPRCCLCLLLSYPRPPITASFSSFKSWLHRHYLLKWLLSQQQMVHQAPSN